MSDPVLAVQGLSLAFGGVTALDDVTFTVERGSITGIIGPNGAGKTTLFDCISGIRKPDAGEVHLRRPDGSQVELIARRPWERNGLGVARTFQNARLFKSVPIGEILRTVQHESMARSGFWRSVLGTRGARADEAEAARWAEEALELVGLTRHADKPPAELSTGMLRLTELAAVAVVRPKVLLLDEPASGIAQAETEALGPLLRRLAEHLDATIVLIEHDMPLVMGISDTIVAMAEGAVVTSAPPDAVRQHPEVLRSYLGTTAA
jgi:ABC-type branched-subunit amino acid transport system ATPase component